MAILPNLEFLGKCQKTLVSSRSKPNISKPIFAQETDRLVNLEKNSEKRLTKFIFNANLQNTDTC